MGRIVEKFACCELSSVDIWVRSSSPFGKGGLRGILLAWQSLTLQISPNPSLPKRGTSAFWATLVKGKQSLDGLLLRKQRLLKLR